MIIYLQFVRRKPGFPSSDLRIVNKQFIQTSAARYVDVDQAAGADDKDDRSITGSTDR